MNRDAVTRRGPVPDAPGPRSEPCGSEHADRLRLRTPVALGDLELDPLPLLQAAVAIRLDGRIVHEHVLATVDRDEAVAFVRVVPLDGALCHSYQLPPGQFPWSFPRLPTRAAGAAEPDGHRGQPRDDHRRPYTG